MSNENENEKKNLPSAPNKNLPAIPSGDGFDVEDREDGFIIGKRLKFNDGVYIVNKTEILSKNPKLQLAITRVVTCWLRWENGKPAEHRVTELGQRHPKREELGYLDESKWEISKFTKKPEDPLKDTRYLYMTDPKTGVDYTFITDTIGGRRAVSELKRVINNVRKEYPKAVVLVELSDCIMPSQWDGTPAPDFKIISWNLGEKGNPPTAPASDPVPAPAPTPQLSPGAAEKPPFDDSAEIVVDNPAEIVEEPPKKPAAKSTSARDRWIEEKNKKPKMAKKGVQKIARR